MNESRLTRLAAVYAALLSDLSLALIIINFFCLLSGFYGMPKFLLWMLFLAGQLIINEALISLQAPMNLYIVFNIAAALGSGALMCLIFAAGLHPDAAGCFTAAAAFTSVHCAYSAYTGHRADMLQRYADFLIIACGLFIFTVYYTGISAALPLAGFPLAVLAADMVLSARLRIYDGCDNVISGGSFSMPWTLAAVAAAAAAAFIIPSYFSGGVHGAVDASMAALHVLWNIFNTAINIFLLVLGSIILFFMRLFPGGGMAAVGYEAGGAAENDVPWEAQAAHISPVVYITAGVLLAALILGVVLYLCRNLRIGRIMKRRLKRGTTRKSHALEELKKFFIMIKDEAAFLRLLKKYRYTPEGVFISCCRYGKRAGLRREASESPGAYVRRLLKAPVKNGAQASCGGKVSGETESTADLSSLAEKLDRLYYAGQKETLTRQEYYDYIKRLKMLEHKQLYKRLKAAGFKW